MDDLGSVAFAPAGRPASATLGDDGRWRCPGLPALAAFLDAAYPGRSSPDEGRPCAAAIRAAAAALGGTPRVPPPSPPIPGVVR